MTTIKFYKKYYDPHVTQTDLKNIEELYFRDIVEPFSVSVFDPCVNLVDLHLSKCILFSQDNHSLQQKLKRATITQTVNLDVKNLFKNTVNLEYLDLSGNNLSDIDFSEPLENLHTLFLTDNNLTTVDPLLFEKVVPNLEILDLSYNKITEIPIFKNLRSFSCD